MILALILATESTDWWDTSIGETFGLILSALVSIAAIAAGVVGIRTIWEHYRRVDAYMIERRRKEALLDLILSGDGWPNGADNIVEAHQDLYNKMVKLEHMVVELTRSVEQVLAETPRGSDLPPDFFGS